MKNALIAIVARDTRNNTKDILGYVAAEWWATIIIGMLKYRLKYFAKEQPEKYSFMVISKETHEIAQPGDITILQVFESLFNNAKQTKEHDNQHAVEGSV